MIYNNKARKISFMLTQHTVVFLVFVCIFNASFVSGIEQNTDTERKNESLNSKVEIELYYMPQCPGCRQIITTSFNDAFNTPGFSDMANVTFVSYGNVRSMKGTLRIFDNVLESCALDKIDHQDEQFQYIDCIDHSHSNEAASKVDIECANAIGLSRDTIREIEICAATAKGHKLANKMVEKSNSVSPEISWYPWIMVNGVHDVAVENEIWISLFKYVCNSYNGPNKSPHCPSEGVDDLLVEQL